MIDPLAGKKVLGALSDQERHSYYERLSTSNLLMDAELKGLFEGDPDRKLYEAREVILAYVQKSEHKLVPASSISPQRNLINQSLDLTLDRFHIQRYPGSSQHVIHINFSVEHLVNKTSLFPDHPLNNIQNVLYGFIVEAVDGQATPPTGAAIFRGLSIDSEFRLRIGTIHMADRVDQRIFEALNSDIMKRGIDLMSTANPVIAMVSQLILGATQMFLSRNKNQGIMEVPVGLLVNASDTDPKLREGSYVLIQADADWVDLNDYCWSPQKARVEHKRLKEELPFNYLIFSIMKSVA